MSAVLPWNLELKDAYGHDKYSPRPGYCRATVHNPLSIGGKQCGNKAKYGDYCGLHAQQLARWRGRLCAECGMSWADPPNSLCPGCEAYKAHTK